MHSNLWSLVPSESFIKAWTTSWAKSWQIVATVAQMRYWDGYIMDFEISRPGTFFITWAHLQDQMRVPVQWGNIRQFCLSSEWEWRSWPDWDHRHHHHPFSWLSKLYRFLWCAGTLTRFDLNRLWRLEQRWNEFMGEARGHFFASDQGILGFILNIRALLFQLALKQLVIMSLTSVDETKRASVEFPPQAAAAAAPPSSSSFSLCRSFTW